jgi:hypothetical protein
MTDRFIDHDKQVFFSGLRYRYFVDRAAAAVIMTAALAIRYGNRQVYPKPDAYGHA